MQIGIIGAGTILPIHVDGYREAGQAVSAVADPVPDLARRTANRFGIAHFAEDWRTLLDRSDVDVIDICTPPKFHAEIAVAALQAGKHVICEKPLAISCCECDRILDAAATSTGRLLVVHQFRSSPFYRRFKWLVDEGGLGQIHFARVQRYDPPPHDLVEKGVWGNWELTGGGVLMTKAIHQLDMLLGLIGPVRRVSAMMGTFVYPIESEDHITANIEFESGAIGNVTVSGQAYGGYGQHFDLFGRRGAVGQPWHLRMADRAEEARLLAELNRRFPEPTAPTSGYKYLVRRIGWKLGRDFFQPESLNLHGLLFRDLFSALENGSDVPVSGREGRAAVELCSAIYAAALSGGTIDLPLDRSSPFYDGVKKDV